MLLSVDLSDGSSFWFRKADLCLCLGTSLQIRPCRDLPRKTKKNGGRVVIVNLQKTSMDSLADLIIHERCDHVMKYILQKLHLHTSLTDPGNYGHVKKVVLLAGKGSVGEKLATDLPAALLHLNESVQMEHAGKARSESDREDPARFCRSMIEDNSALCSSHSIWIIDGLQRQTDIDFFQTTFNDRLLLVRVEASNDTRENAGHSESECQLGQDVPWSFTFSNNEQMTDLLEMIRS